MPGIETTYSGFALYQHFLAHGEFERYGVTISADPTASQVATALAQLAEKAPDLFTSASETTPDGSLKKLIASRDATWSRQFSSRFGALPYSVFQELRTLGFENIQFASHGIMIGPPEGVRWADWNTNLAALKVVRGQRTGADGLKNLFSFLQDKKKVIEFLSSPDGTGVSIAYEVSFSPTNELKFREYPVEAYSDFGMPMGVVTLNVDDILPTHSLKTETKDETIARVKAELRIRLASEGMTDGRWTQIDQTVELLANGPIGLHLLQNKGLDGKTSDSRFDPEILATNTTPNPANLDHEILFRIPINVATRERFRQFKDSVTRLLSVPKSEERAVASIPSGHMRDLLSLKDSLKGRPQMHHVRVIAIDRDAASLEGAQNLASQMQVDGVEYVWRDAFKLNIPEQLDVLTSHGLNPYLDDAQVLELYKQFFKALKPGGSLVVSQIVPDNEWQNSPEDMALYDLLYKQIIGVNFNHQRTENKTRQLLIEAGFKAEDIEVRYDPKHVISTFEVRKPRVAATHASATRNPQDEAQLRAIQAENARAFAASGSLGGESASSASPIVAVQAPKVSGHTAGDDSVYVPPVARTVSQLYRYQPGFEYPFDFLLDLAELQDQPQEDIQSVQVHWHPQLPVISIQAPHIPTLNSFQFYIFDEDGNFMGREEKFHNGSELPLNYLASRGLTFLDNPFNFIYLNEHGQTTTQTQVILARCKKEEYTQQADETQLRIPAIKDFRDQIEMAYLKARFLVTPDVNAPGPADFSREAMRQAWRRVHPKEDVLVKTTPFEPVLRGDPVFALLAGGAQVFAKDETVQYQNNFKARGATNFLSWHIENGWNPSRTAVVAASHGNHAQGVVWAANQLGFAQKLLVMPAQEQTSKLKIRRCLEGGAAVVLFGRNLAESMEKAQNIQQKGLKPQLPGDVLYLPAWASDQEINAAIRTGRTIFIFGNLQKNEVDNQETSIAASRELINNFQANRLFVPTYDDPRVAMGQATSMMEILGQMPQLLTGAWTYLTPAGGGGKMAGDIAVAKAMNPQVRVVGLNDERVPVLYRSLNARRLSPSHAEIEAPEEDTFADGTDVPDFSPTNFAEILKQKGEAGLVTSQEIAEALVFASTQKWFGAEGEPHKVEGATATTLAALFNGVVQVRQDERVVLALTGNNIDRRILDRAGILANWVNQDPKFYAFVCGLRKKIRAEESEGRAANLVHLINACLSNERVRQLLHQLWRQNFQLHGQKFEDQILSFFKKSEINLFRFAPLEVRTLLLWDLADYAGITGEDEYDFLRLGLLDEIIGPPNLFGIDERADLTALQARGIVSESVLREARGIRERLSPSDPWVENQKVGLGKTLAEKYPPKKGFKAWMEREQDQLNLLLQENPDLLRALMLFTDVLPEVAHNPKEVVRLFREFLKGPDGRLPDYMNKGISLARQNWIPSLLRATGIQKAVEASAGRFIAGENAQAAMERMIQMAESGQGVIADILGEATTNETQAKDYVLSYLDLMETMAGNAQFISRVRANYQRLEAGAQLVPLFGAEHRVDFQVSVKPSSLYSQWNPADPEGTASVVKERFRLLLDRIQYLEQSKGVKVGITIDLEQYEYRDLTYKIFKELFMEEKYRSMENVGIVLQAYLKDSELVLNDLAEWSRRRRMAGGGKSIQIRPVKGAYWDYESMMASQKGLALPVFPEKWMSDANYHRIIDVLLNNADSLRGVVASHNVESLAYALNQAHSRHIPLAVQMLLGMGDDYKARVIEKGVEMDVYTPIGPLGQGMAYLARRILENTSSQSALLANTTGEPNLDDPMKDRSWGVTREVPQFTGVTDINAPFSNEPATDVSRPDEQAKVKYFLSQLRQARLAHNAPRLGVLGVESLTLPHSTKPDLILKNPSRPLEIVATAENTDVDGVRIVVGASADAFESWSQTPIAQRAQYLLQVAAAMRRDKPKLIAVMMQEVGKTFREADGEVAEAIDFLEYYAREALRHQDANPDIDFVAKGPTAVIGPWNFPLAIPTGMIAAAMVAGNPVVFKPSERSALTGSYIYRYFQEVGLPKNVLSYLPGDGLTGKALVENAHIKAVVFTGSSQVGFDLYRKGLTQGVKVVAETGGKNALIVDSNAHPDDVVKTVMAAAFGYGGQKCSALSRLVVVGAPAQYEKIKRMIVAAAWALRLGDPEDFGNALGPVIDEKAYRQIMHVIKEARNRNWGNFLIGPAADRDETDGYFVPPTIFDLDAAGRQTDLWTKEVFGPVLAMTRVGTFDEAIRVAEDSDYGLTGGVITRSPENERKAREEFKQVGNLYINRSQTGAIVGRHPFGGLKRSNTASAKAGGPEYIDQLWDWKRKNPEKIDPAKLVDVAKAEFEKAAEMMRARVQGQIALQPELLGEKNVMQFSGRGAGVIVFGQTMDLAEAAYLVGAAIYAGNDVTVLYASTHKLEVSALQTFLGGFNRNGHRTSAQLKFTELDGGDVSHKLGEEIKTARWVAITRRSTHYSKVASLVVEQQPGQNFARSLIAPLDILSGDPSIFTGMTEARVISTNTARHGAVFEQNQPLDRAHLNLLSNAGGYFADDLIDGLLFWPEVRELLNRMYDEDSTVKNLVAHRLKALNAELSRNHDWFPPVLPLGLFKLIIVFRSLQGFAGGEEGMRLAGRVLQEIGYSQNEIRLVQDVLSVDWHDFKKIESAALASGIPVLDLIAILEKLAFIFSGNGHEVWAAHRTTVSQRVRLYDLVKAPQQVSPGIFLFTRLGDSYELQTKEGKSSYVKTANGVHAWDEVADLIEIALAQAPRGSSVQFALSQYEFGQLEIPRDIQTRISQIISQYPDKEFLMSIQGDPLDLPQFFRGEHGNWTTGTRSMSRVIEFWRTADIKGLIDRGLSLHAEESTLHASLIAVHTQVSHHSPRKTWGQYLELVRQEYNSRVRRAEAKIPDDKRTQIFDLLGRLRQLILTSVQENRQLLTNRGIQIPLGAELFDSITAIKSYYRPDTSPENQILSIGGGAMAAQLATSRRLIDLGKLPLDFRMTVVDVPKAAPLVWEVNELGTNRGAFGREKLNPDESPRKIYYINAAQRDEFLRQNKPAVVLLNLKAENLTEQFLQEDLLAILAQFNPVMAAPAKAYDSNGRIPYLDIYKKLLEKGHVKLAGNFLVEGGFFSAPNILKGENNYMTIAGATRHALEVFARVMSPQPIDSHSRADWEATEIKFIESKEIAAFLMAGGANKNFLTYRLGHMFMREVMELADQKLRSADELSRLQEKLQKAKEENVALSEEILARVIPHYGLDMRVDHLWTPNGLRRDIYNCAPPDLEDLYKIRGVWFQLAQLSQKSDFQIGLIKLMATIEAGQEKGGLGEGTRNARDGYMDVVLEFAYEHARGKGWLEGGQTAIAFRNFYSPWSAKTPQEGRAGIGGLIKFAEANGITLPEEVYDAWNRYNPDQIRKASLEATSKTVERNLDTEPRWGLPRDFVGVLGTEVRLRLRMISEHQQRREVGTSMGRRTQEFLLNGLGDLSNKLRERPQEGVYPEVSAVLTVLENRFNILIELLLEERHFSPEQLHDAEKAFRKTLENTEKLFSDTPPTTAKIIIGLRHAAQNLYRVELALNEELKRQVQLNGNGHGNGSNVPRTANNIPTDLPRVHSDQPAVVSVGLGDSGQATSGLLQSGGVVMQMPQNVIQPASLGQLAVDLSVRPQILMQSQQEVEGPEIITGPWKESIPKEVVEARIHLSGIQAWVDSQPQLGGGMQVELKNELRDMQARLHSINDVMKLTQKMESLGYNYRQAMDVINFICVSRGWKISVQVKNGALQVVAPVLATPVSPTLRPMTLQVTPPVGH